MKIHLLSAAFILFTISSCDENKNKINNGTQNSQSSEQNISEKNQKLEIDSIKIEDSLIIAPTLTASYQQKVLVFKGLEKQVLDSLYKTELYHDNKPMKEYSKTSIQNALQNQLEKYYDDTKKEMIEYRAPHFKQTWNKYSKMDFFSNLNDYLTIHYSGDGYTGGAHGYAYENYKVVDLKAQKKIMLEDIMDVNKVNWQEVLLKNIFDKDLLFDKNISYNQNFYFDQNHITFVYNQYEIAPYAAGIIEVTIPFSQLNEALKSDFKQRMGNK